MMVLKKWKLYVLGLVLLASCKSADCGCPMAESTKINKEVSEVPNTHYKAITTD